MFTQCWNWSPLVSWQEMERKLHNEGRTRNVPWKFIKWHSKFASLLMPQNSLFLVLITHCRKENYNSSGLPWLQQPSSNELCIHLLLKFHIPQTQLIDDHEETKQARMQSRQVRNWWVKCFKHSSLTTELYVGMVNELGDKFLSLTSAKFRSSWTISTKPQSLY